MEQLAAAIEAVRRRHSTNRQQRVAHGRERVDLQGGVVMADTYCNFAELAQHERAGIDYGVRLRRDEPAFAIMTPHGGGIEPGTSELADAIAGETSSFYAFDGLKSSGNAVLHITSTNFDEPLCLLLLNDAATVITLHGEHSEDDGEGVFVGGLDEPLGARIGAALRRKGFDVRTHTNPNLQGREPENLCNRGTSGKGVQLELSKAVRRTLFESLTRTGRQHPTERFDVFVGAVRRALQRAATAG
jgi:phage replication-related protein YjqB (UPF0714/DUF867 family)